MSPAVRRPRAARLSVAALAGALALALSVLPAEASTGSGVATSAGTTGAAPASPGPALAGAPAFTVQKTGGMTQLSDTAQVEATGSVVFDTRVPWDSHGGASRLGAGATLTIDLANSGLTAPGDATAMILNVTAVSPTRTGWVTVWPSDRTRPATSTLNYAPGTPTPNLAVVPVTASRKLRVMNGSTGTTHVLVSFSGWVRSNGGAMGAGSLTPTTGSRVVDTRAAGTAIAAKGYRDVTVAGHGVPAGAAAALLDVIAVRPTRSGYLVAHPSDTARPGTTTLSYRVGSDRAALSLVRLSATGKVRLWNLSSAPVHVVVDTFGWVGAGDSSARPAATQALQPTRVLDTRKDGTTVSGAGVVSVPLPTDALGELSGRPSGVVLAVTATRASSTGHLMIDVDGNVTRNSGSLTPSVLNFAPGETVTNTTYVTVPSHGRLALATNGPGVQVVVDLVGVVRHRIEVSGRLLEESGGAPVHPGLAGTPSTASLRVPTVADGSFRMTGGDQRSTTKVCGTKALPTGEPDPGWAVACLGGGVAPVDVPQTVGSRVVTADLRVPRLGRAAGVVTAPAGTSPSGSLMALLRLDGQYLVGADVAADGRWVMPSVPEGTYLALLRGTSALFGEAVHDLPLDLSGAVTTEQRTAMLLDAGAKTFVVSPSADTAVDDASLLVPGSLTVRVDDPDGSLGNVTTTWRHQSGYVVASGPASASLTRKLRPGLYTVCATEGSTTVCNGGAPSWQDATPITVESGATTTTTLTLP